MLGPWSAKLVYILLESAPPVIALASGSVIPSKSHECPKFNGDARSAGHESSKFDLDTLLCHGNSLDGLGPANS
jgi:hypothetical protein